MMDREKVRTMMDIQLAPHEWEEKEKSISVVGGAKFIFLPNGEIKSIIRGGKSYGPSEKAS